MFERWTIGLFNVIFTAWPPLALGLFDRPVPDAALQKYPEIYELSQRRDAFSVKVTLPSLPFHSSPFLYLQIYPSEILDLDRYGGGPFTYALLFNLWIPAYDGRLGRWPRGWLADVRKFGVYSKFASIHRKKFDDNSYLFSTS